MGKDKIRRFRENETFRNLVQPDFEDIFRKDHSLKGKWRDDFFGNQNPIVLELGCGRGEYAVSMGEKFPDKNFIGVDIKGARMWRGAKTATQNEMLNVGFLRTRIEFIGSFFAPEEVDEIWITFPDPQLRKNRVKKRLTSPGFLEMYSRFLKPGGKVHLKTDCLHLHKYTKAVTGANDMPVEFADADIYGNGSADDVLSIKTTYEARFLSEGKPITYIRFRLGESDRFIIPDFAPDDEL